MKHVALALSILLLATSGFAADEQQPKKTPKLASDAEATNIDQKPEHEGNVSSIGEIWLCMKGILRLMNRC